MQPLRRERARKGHHRCCVVVVRSPKKTGVSEHGRAYSVHRYRRCVNRCHRIIVVVVVAVGSACGS
jgi:hypothetical protein